MIPYILAAVGGYLIGQSQKKDVPQMSKGGKVYEPTEMKSDVEVGGYYIYSDYNFNPYPRSADEVFIAYIPNFSDEQDGYADYSAFSTREEAIENAREYYQDLMDRGVLSPKEVMAKGGMQKDGEDGKWIPKDKIGFGTKYASPKNGDKVRLKLGNGKYYYGTIDGKEILWEDGMRSNRSTAFMGDYSPLQVLRFAKGGMAKGRDLSVEVSVTLTKDEALVLYVVLDTKLKKEGKKIINLKDDVLSKLTKYLASDSEDDFELRVTLEQIYLMYLYLEELQAQEPKFKPRTFTAIRKKLHEAEKRSSMALPKHFAMGGVLEHGLREGDRLLVANDKFAGIIDKDGQRVIVDIEEGKRRASTI